MLYLADRKKQRSSCQGSLPAFGLLTEIFNAAKNRVRATFGNTRHPASRLSRIRHCSGFSLIEVVLAIGIVAFAFIPMLGLIPIGLSTSRQAIDNTIEAQILQELTNQAQQTDFSSLNSTLVATWPSNYDSDGNVTSGTSVYTATITYATGPTFPGDTPGTATTTRLGIVTIKITSTRSLGVKKSIVFVADNGR